MTSKKQISVALDHFFTTIVNLPCSDVANKVADQFFTQLFDGLKTSTIIDRTNDLIKEFEQSFPPCCRTHLKAILMQFFADCNESTEE